MLLILFCIVLVSATSPLPPQPLCPGLSFPESNVECGPNAYYAYCPPTCPGLCPLKECPCGPEENCCRPGCLCNNGYVRSSKTGMCIKLEDCPIKCNKNEHLEVDSRACRRTCGNRIPPNNSPCRPFTGCVCDDGYVRPYDNATGTCIPVNDCPPIPKKCGLNEVPTSCKIKCPPQSCEISYTTYHCLPSECEPGCNCKANYLRNKDNICIFNNDCPAPGNPTTPNPCTPPPKKCSKLTQTSSQSSSSASASAHASSSSHSSNSSVKSEKGKITSQTSQSSSNANAAAQASSSSHTSGSTVTSGNGTVVKSSSSSSSSSASSSSSSSSSSSTTTTVIKGNPCKCQPTCEYPNPPGCPARAPNASDPCSCQPGYILSRKGGKCIKIEHCPRNLTCNGDPHAYIKECPQPCPSTCDRPNAIQCRKKCEPFGCECADGYILSEYHGKCILPDDCPGGNPCGKNEIFVPCKVPCPSDYCPEFDILRNVVCDMSSYCLSGCVCKHNHKRKSKKDPTCILAEKCPPVPCTRPNEEWNPCRPFCPYMNCEEAEKYCSPPFIRTCDPRCTCYDGYFRNSSDICVPLKDCPKPR